tara:strand:- start:6939 stop:7310 length:372 start_codon:yes stop_codon:yes gene_type:complete
MKNYKTRTTTQNAAIHKYFELLAEAFNDAGYTQKHEIFSKVDLNWTAHSIKEGLFKPILEVKTGKKSTADATTVEISEIHKILNLWCMQNTGIDVPFPDRYGCQETTTKSIKTSAITSETKSS